VDYNEVVRKCSPENSTHRIERDGTLCRTYGTSHPLYTGKRKRQKEAEFRNVVVVGSTALIKGPQRKARAIGKGLIAP